MHWPSGTCETCVGIGCGGCAPSVASASRRGTVQLGKPPNDIVPAEQGEAPQLCCTAPARTNGGGSSTKDSYRELYTLVPPTSPATYNTYQDAIMVLYTRGMSRRRSARTLARPLLPWHGPTQLLASLAQDSIGKESIRLSAYIAADGQRRLAHNHAEA
eukprot:6186949-Pleurochrysis_carterae.AAC.3